MKRASVAKRDAAKLAVVNEVVSHPRGAREGLTRAHIEQLRQVGLTKAEVLVMVVNLGGEQLASLIEADLDSYGDWA